MSRPHRLRSEGPNEVEDRAGAQDIAVKEQEPASWARARGQLRAETTYRLTGQANERIGDHILAVMSGPIGEGLEA